MRAPRVHHAARRRGGAWPLAARAQQPAMPVIGFLSSVPFETRRDQVAGFHRGLNEVRLCRSAERGDRIPIGGQSN